MSDESANTSTTGFHLDDIEATWSKQDGWAGDATIQSNRIYGQPPSYHSISLTLTGTENIGGSSTNVWVYTPTGPMELPFHCFACGKRWGDGDVASTTNGEPFRHTDCSDPTLERDIDDSPVAVVSVPQNPEDK